jgi:hypothetical protein
MPTRSLESAHLISEKILQRYVFEKLSGSASTRRDLLPSRLRSKAGRFKVLIPEYDLKEPNHRADFRLIFPDKFAQNIEVEWKTSRFKHGEQVAKAHYADENGFILTLEDDRDKAPDYVKALDVREIDPEEFSWWFSKRAKTLLDSTIAAHTESYSVRPRKYWVIYVGKRGKAQSDYLELGRPNGKWAFRYGRGENLANMMSILKRDIVIFGAKWKIPGGRRTAAGGDWSCSHVDVFEVSRGYWCDFLDKTFEKNWTGRPEDKEYMHYFAFSYAANKEELYRTTNEITIRGANFDKNNPVDVELCDAFTQSNTQHGAPVEISQSAFEDLRQRLELSYSK